MERIRKVSKYASESLDMIAMLDLDYEHEKVKHSVTMPVYQCPNSLEFVIFFEPEENVLIIGKSYIFFEAGTNLRDNLIEHYRQKQ